MGSCKYVTPPQVVRYFRGFEDRRIQLTNLLFENRTIVEKLIPEVDRLLDVISEGCSYRDLFKSPIFESYDVLPKLFALVTSGMAKFSPDVSNYVLSADFSDLVNNTNNIDIKYREIISKNYFEVLGVDQQSPPQYVASRYYETALNYLEDIESNSDLTPVVDRVSEIHNKIDDAYYTVAHAVRRAEYLTYLERRARGLATDKVDIQRSELLFRRAMSLCKKKTVSNGSSNFAKCD